MTTEGYIGRNGPSLEIITDERVCHLRALVY